MKWVARFKAGNNNNNAFSSQDQPFPLSPNARSKYESESDFKQQWEAFLCTSKSDEKEKALVLAVGAFCALVHGCTNPTQLVNMLPDARVFSFEVAKALVTGIENLKTDGNLDAEIVIFSLTYTQMDGTGACSNILRALEILVSPPLDLQPLLDAGLFSSLVFILYVLLDPSEGDAISSETDEYQKLRPLAEATIVHIMKALANHPGACKSLADGDALKLLFHVVARSSCEQTMVCALNEDVLYFSSQLVQLHRHAMQILGILLVSDNGITAQYIHRNYLIKVLLKVIKDFNSDVGDAEYAVGVVDLLLQCMELSWRPDALGVQLKDDLQNCHGYKFLEQLALQLSSSSVEGNLLPTRDFERGTLEVSYEEAGSNPLLLRLLDILVNFSHVGAHENPTAFSKPSGNRRRSSLSDGNNFSEYHSKVKDMDAVKVLQDIFLKSKSVQLQLDVLDRLSRIFASHTENYELCQEIQIVSLFIQNMASFPEVVQEKLLKILEYAVTVVHCAPKQELHALCGLLQQSLSPSLRHAILSSFIKLFSFDKQYKNLFREVGVLKIFIDDLKHVSASVLLESQAVACNHSEESASLSYNDQPNPVMKLKSRNSGLFERKYRIFEDEGTVSLAWDCIVALLKDADGNQEAFRKANGVNLVLPLLTKTLHRAGVLQLLACLICESTDQCHTEELVCLVDILKMGIVPNMSGQQLKINEDTSKDILWCLHRILSMSSVSKDTFGSTDGLRLLLTVLHKFQVSQEDQPDVSGFINKDSSELTLTSTRMEVFEALMHVAIMAVSGDSVNRGRLHKIITTQTFKDLLHESGLLCPEHEDHVADLLFCVALEQSNTLLWGSMQSSNSLPVMLPTGSSDTGGHEADMIDEAENMVEKREELLEDIECNVTSEHILNAGAIEVLISCLKYFSPNLQMKVLDSIKKFAQGNMQNQECLTAVGCISLLLEFAHPIPSTPPSLLDCILEIIEALGSFRLSPFELRTLARLIGQSTDSSLGDAGKKLIESMERMLCMEYSLPERHSLAPFVEFMMSKFGCSFMNISLGERTWPPTSGYSFVCWFRFTNVPRGTVDPTPPPSLALNGSFSKRRGNSTSVPSKQLAKIQIFSICSAEEKVSFADLFMDDSGVLTLATSPSSYLSFKGVCLEEGLWYHLAVVHSKPKTLAGLFQSSIAHLYVNGKRRQTGKLGYSASPIGNSLQAAIGTSSPEAEARISSWQMGSCYLFEEVLSAPAIFLMYTLGRGYRGLFQDPDLLHFIPYEACGGENLATLETLEVESAKRNTNQKGDSALKAKADRTGIVWDFDRLATFSAQLSSRKLIFAFDGTPLEHSVTPSTLCIVNLVDPLSAAASPLGGVPKLAQLHGDAHICSPCSFSESIRKVGGVAVALALVEAAESKEMLHLALTLMACALHWSPFNARDMQALRGYHLLVLFLHRRMQFFDMRDLDILLRIASCEASSFIRSVITTQRLNSSSSIVTDTSNLEDGLLIKEDQGSLVGSQIDSSDIFSQQEVMSHASEVESFDGQSETSQCLVLSNPEMMEHVLLDWTLWVTAPAAVQLALLAFIERLISMHQYRNHNLALLRRMNIARHLLVTIQRGDVEVAVLEKLVVLLGILLEDGFLQSELKYVVDFVIMTFDPPEIGERSDIQRENMGVQVVVRNMLLEMLIDLQVTISSDELLGFWHKNVSTKLITFLLDEAMHPSSMRWVLTLVGICISASADFANKFRSNGGYQGLVQVLPSFYDSPEVYYILFCLIFDKPVYPRQPEVRMLDFHNLMPSDGSIAVVRFLDLLEPIIAMVKSAFVKLTFHARLAEQTGDQAYVSTVLAACLKGSGDTSEQLQGEALLHKTFAARLMGGEAAAPMLVTSILRFMVDLAKMCRPFSIAFRRQDLLEGCAELYFSCVRSAFAVQIVQSKIESEGFPTIPDYDDPAQSSSGSADIQEHKKNDTSIGRMLLEHRKSRGGDVVSIPRTISGAKDIGSLTEDEALHSEEIVCDVTLFEMDDLDRFVAFAADPPVVVKTMEERNIDHSIQSQVDTEFSGSTNLGALLQSDLSCLKPAYASSFSPLGASASWLGSASMSESNTFPGFSSMTSSSSVSDFDSVTDDKQMISSSSSTDTFFEDMTSDFLLKLDVLGAGGGPCPAAAGAVLDLIAEVLADALSEQPKATALVELVLEATPLYIGSDPALIFQGLCLSRLMIFFERRLLRDEEELHKKLEKSKWSLNLETFSCLLVDHVYMGSFPESGPVFKVLEFLLSMLQLANKDRCIEDATPLGKSLLSRSRGGRLQVDPYVHALLKSINRMILYCFTPSFLNSIGEDEFLASSSCPRTEIKRVDEGDGRSSSSVIDVCTVLQLVIANKNLVFCAINMDTDLVCCLCVNTISMLWDSRSSVRNLAIEVMKSLLLFRKASLEELLVVRPSQGESFDVLHNGFDKLLSNDQAHFFQWLRASKEIISKVLEQCASIMWMQFVSEAEKFPGVKLKASETRRKKEMSRRLRETSKGYSWHLEQTHDRRYALKAVRESMATELNALCQDRYGWILHAESEWKGHLQQLVHERGIWPISKLYNETAEWQLCSLEGPYRMRKKIVRCKNVEILSRGLQLFSKALEDKRLLFERNFLTLNIAEPDYDSFFHAFPLGAANHKQNSSGSEDLMGSFEYDQDFKATEESEFGYGENFGSYDEVGHDGGLQLACEVLRVNSGRSVLSSTLEDFPLSCFSSVKQSIHMSEMSKLEGGGSKPKRTLHDDGEYLIRPYLQPGEKILFCYNCERVLGMEKHDGIFLIGENYLYIIEHYFMDESGFIKEKGGHDDISVIDQATGVTYPIPDLDTFEEKQEEFSDAANAWPGGRAWAYNGGAGNQNNINNKNQMAHAWHMWKLDDVHELLKRRYQLRQVAIELFTIDGCNDLLVFHKKERDEVFKTLVSMNLPRHTMLETSVSGSSKREGNENSRFFRIMAKSFSKRWQNGEISNFQYLMHLNTLAGRSYNDLTQYPVFPWVLADYNSESLDISDPKSFRRLDKPMGALTTEREEMFKRRYDECGDDPEIKKFHYGSHYSSAGAVLYYMIRLPPFTEENKKMQGGMFDHADRLFTSIEETWLSCSQGNTTDVKELIPEFFYMPEFLENRFNTDLGVKQSGEKVDDVILPAWAKGSTRKFIRLHREALESQYVSENLHHWIDLIFGYKQSGKAAIDATNVFFHLTYEGAVDIDSIQDPVQKASILDQINHFGQTPKQLFKKPHPRRRYRQKAPLVHCLRHHNLLTPLEVRTITSAVSQIVVQQDKVLVAGLNQFLKPHSYNKYVAWGFPDHSLRFISNDQDKILSTHEGLHGGSQISCAAVSSDGNILVTGGDDGVVAVWRIYEDGDAKQMRLHLLRALWGHAQKVTCIAVCQAYSLIVSGSEDRSVIFWDLSSLEFVRQLSDLPAAASAVYANEMTGEVVTAAGTSLSVWSINGDCLATVKASPLPSDIIMSVSSSCFSDWMETNWFVTGHRSGSVKLWCMDYNSSNASKSHANHTASDEKSMCISNGIFVRLSSVPEYRLVLLRVLKWHKKPITCIHLGSDLKQLFSGDAGGHLVSWTLPDQSLKNLSLLETQMNVCSSCHLQMKATDARQRCKSCGRELCMSCCGDNNVSGTEACVASIVCRNCHDFQRLSSFGAVRT